MLTILPILFLLLTALTLLILRQVRPNFRYFWLMAASGTLAAWISTFLWRFRIPITFAPFNLESETLSVYKPVWLVDSVSWPYALIIVTLALSVIITSVIREVRDPLAWIGTLLLTTFGLSAVTSESVLTLLLAWAALDFLELTIGLLTTGSERSEGVVIAFASRMIGIGLVSWAIVTEPGYLLNLRLIPQQVGIFLVLAVGIRIGVLPLHLPYQESSLRRGFGTTFRLVSAASCLAILGRIPANILEPIPTSILLILTALAAFYAGWMWVRSAEELTGRPFWLLGMGSLSIGAAVSGNPVGSIAWGIALVLGGSLIFLYSARQRSIIWLPYLGILGISTFSFTLTAAGWNASQSHFWLFWLSHLPGWVLLIAGIIKHGLHPGESAFESLPIWARIFYPLGLGLAALVLLLLGVWGWEGSANIGRWWASLPGIPIAIGIVWLASRLRGRSLQYSSRPTSWLILFRLEWLYRWFWSLYRFLGRISDMLSTQLEGDSGILWSLVILVLLISVVMQTG